MIISGACHYFRTHPDQWRTRLHWLRLMGLDTVETYVPWNLHEPSRGEFRFDGIADLELFLRLAAEEGLGVILRPGPYICAEWDNGGLPSWLTGRTGLRLRTSDPGYQAEVERWFGELLPRVLDHLETRGGPITMVQVENEYGSYGSDTTHLEWVRDLLVEQGIDVPLFTSDGPEDFMFTGGTVDGARATANFGSRPAEAFAELRRHRPDDAPFCMEWWNGWFDHWGDTRHTRDASEAASVLDEMLTMGASVNLYMAHGGTSFGVTAGANYEPPGAVAGGSFQPTVTSYDYDAPLDERGAPTPKFHAYREVIARHRDVPALEEFDEPLLPETTLLGEGTVVPLAGVFDVLAAAGREVTAPGPLSFEELGLSHGLVRYRATVRGPRTALPLSVDGLADRAQLVIDGRVEHVFDRNHPTTYDLEVPASGRTIDLIVESMGRVNYGRLVGERKGITGAVLHERQEVHGWAMTPLELGELPDLSGVGEIAGDGAGFRTFTFSASAPGDSYLDLSGWGKGYAWVNGFGLGRYWSVGPQLSLYVPRPVVVPGLNTVVLLELDDVGAAAPVLRPERVWR
ncbi:beta-galactosidase [Nocardioides sp. KC13]|uniref:Beta-galactosidase n=1 Tax=Nocardioides turkmenicus TaxID=2711220 RepID=A0A6M1R4Y8_9ACTN|nr:beta-galactosidase [Nocardioides sp. KC13]